MIIGDQIRLRAIEKEDLPLFVKWLNDPEVRQGLSLIMPLSLTEEEDWYAGMLKRSPFERPLAIEIQPDPRKEVWVFVGNCGFINIDWQITQSSFPTNYFLYFTKQPSKRIEVVTEAYKSHSTPQ